MTVFPPAISGVPLPDGDVFCGMSDGRPLGWLSTFVLWPDDLDRYLQACTQAYPDTGLWPLRLARDTNTWWTFHGSDGEPSNEHDDLTDVWASLAHAHHHRAPRYLAAPAIPGSGPESEQFRLGERGRLMLVSTKRPADIPHLLGWSHPLSVEYINVSTVLRSWEDRFGVTLIGIGHDTMDFIVPRGRLYSVERESLAEEIELFCPDFFAEVEPDFREQFHLEEKWSFWWWF